MSKHRIVSINLDLATETFPSYLLSFNITRLGEPPVKLAIPLKAEDTVEDFVYKMNRELEKCEILVRVHNPIPTGDQTVKRKAKPIRVMEGDF